MKITFLSLVFSIIFLISSSFCLSLENVEYAYLPQGYSAFYFGKIIKILLNSISFNKYIPSYPFYNSSLNSISFIICAFLIEIKIQSHKMKFSFKKHKSESIRFNFQKNQIQHVQMIM